MDEIWVRVAIIATVVALAVGTAIIQRRRALNPVRSVDARGLQAGIYFFSSITCATCTQAREKLDSVLGSNGYTEIAWEKDADQFERLGVDAVPAVVIVDEGGRGRLYPGQPDEALESRPSH